jgi:2-hydroxy-3-keto-5-methylthiopentenyl-1-phosphate phosphatase
MLFDPLWKPTDRSLIPAPENAQVWIDFDGTITQLDVLDELIKGFAIDDSWKKVEREWQEGLIGSAECLRRQLAAVRISDVQLEKFLDTIPLDPGIFPLLELLGRKNVPVCILSDGIDLFIRRLLDRAGLGEIGFRCNSIQRTGPAMELICPHASPACESAAAHCKCASMASMGIGRTSTIYIGDGRSDLCPSRKAGCRFAKGVLAMHLEREGFEHLPYSTLDQVASMLATTWGTEISI